MTDHIAAHDRADRALCVREGARSSTAFAFAVCLLSAAAPAPAASQMHGALVGHVGHSSVAPGSAMLDLAAEVGQGPFAVRAGAGVDAAATPFAPLVSGADRSTGAWTADADLGFDFGRVPILDRLVGRWHPTAFIGAGFTGLPGGEQAGGSDRSSIVPTWSWGGRAGTPLFGPLSVEAELRRRETLGDVSPEEYPVDQAWEYRIGFALRFGGAAPRASTRAAAGRRGRTTPSRPARTTRTISDTRRAASAAEIADNAIDFGDRYIGTPYVWGGESPSGFDCSGFVQYVYRRQGIELPRVSRDQARAGVALPASLDGIARGDLLFFASDGRTVSHVGIYAGNGRMLHSSSSGRGVRYDDLRGSRGGWYVNHLVAVRRVIHDGWYPLNDLYAGADDDVTMPGRALPVDDAFEALVGDRGDEDAPAAN